MAKIKLTRNELKAQREALNRYNRFLPTLELKKMQLELERRRVLQEMNKLQEELEKIRQVSGSLQKLISESYPKPIQNMVRIIEVKKGETNIAGIFMPIFQDISFDVDNYDRFLTPPWVDKGILFMQELLRWQEKWKILQEQEEILAFELRRTTQRINLFKERLIPQCKENIRQIRICLGDMQAAAVGRSKIAKSKNQKVNAIKVEENY